jgi:hypothetical protein
MQIRFETVGLYVDPSPIAVAPVGTFESWAPCHGFINVQERTEVMNCAQVIGMDLSC